MIRVTATRAAIISVLSLAAGCAPVGNSNPPASATGSGVTPLTPEQRGAGWRSLFDGSGTSAWRGYQQKAMPAGWRIVNGVLTKTDSVPDIVTRDQFGDFELAFDWMESPRGNAGVFYRGTEEYDHVYWSAPEYQLLDDAGDPESKNRVYAAGAAYALYRAPAGIVKPANEWNSALIVVQGNRVQHWANGQKLLEYEIGSPDWIEKIKASKFSAYPRFGLAKRGYIGIQGDHPGTLSIRNVRIREIK